MNDLERFKVLLYEFLWFEEGRAEESLDFAYHLMIRNNNDSYYVIKYYEAVRRYEDFRIIQEKLLNLLSTF